MYVSSTYSLVCAFCFDKHGICFCNPYAEDSKNARASSAILVKPWQLWDCAAFRKCMLMIFCLQHLACLVIFFLSMSYCWLFSSDAQWLSQTTRRVSTECFLVYKDPEYLPYCTFFGVFFIKVLWLNLCIAVTGAILPKGEMVLLDRLLLWEFISYLNFCQVWIFIASKPNWTPRHTLSSLCSAPVLWEANRTVPVTLLPFLSPVALLSPSLSTCVSGSIVYIPDILQVSMGHIHPRLCVYVCACPSLF